MEENIFIKKINGQPWGLAFDEVRDRILVTDCKSSCLLVVKRSNLEIIDCIGSKGKNPEQFNWPSGIAIQPHGGNIVVVDSVNHRVKVLTPDCQHLFTIDHLFCIPTGICCKPDSGIIVAEEREHRIRLFDSSGRHIHKFGTKGEGDREFHTPFDVTVLDHGFAPSSVASSVLLVADYSNRRVCVWSADGSRFVGKFDMGGRPRGLCVNLDGYVFVSSNVDIVEAFEPRFNFRKCANINIGFSTPLLFPTGMCIDNHNTLTVANTCNSCIVRPVLTHNK